MNASDEYFMKHALEEAEAAAREGEVPVGCVIVKEGRILCREHNRREQLADPTAHAEILALRGAAEELRSWRLTDCTCYVNLEPCCMCAGALVQARVARLVYGLDDPKSGGCGSVFDVVREPRLNHSLEVSGGVLAEECLRLLQSFFKERRQTVRGDAGDAEG